MCIRDRSGPDGVTIFFLFYKLFLFSSYLNLICLHLSFDFNNLLTRLPPGSYTHLEVDKRQCMHNVDENEIFRPAAWNAFGMDKEGADYRACTTYGPIYK